MVTVGDNTSTVRSLTVKNSPDLYIDTNALGDMTIWNYPTTNGYSSISIDASKFSVNVLCPYRIEKVIFHDPATIVIWKDKTKTVVKCHNEPYDREKGLAMCISKKVLGEKFHSTLREWCGGDAE